MPFAVPKMKKHLAQTATFSKVQGGLVPALGELIVGAVANRTDLFALRWFDDFLPRGAKTAYPGTAKATLGGRTVRQRQAVLGSVQNP